jgi:hypothetical protein
LGFSRFSGGWMVPSRAAHDVLGGQLEVLRQFGAVPRRMVWDQEGCIGRRRGGETTLTAEFSAFIGTLGTGAVILNRADPEAKGIVERNNDYYETSFLPGRSFESVADFNAQFTAWLRRANNRIHATTKVRPAEAIYEDRGSMLTFPPVLPDVALRFGTRVPRDHTSGSTPTTTRSTRALWAAASRCAPVSTPWWSPAIGRSGPAPAVPGQASGDPASPSRKDPASHARQDDDHHHHVRSHGRTTGPGCL